MSNEKLIQAAEMPDVILENQHHMSHAMMRSALEKLRAALVEAKQAAQTLEERNMLLVALKELYWRARKEIVDPEDVPEIDAADRLLNLINEKIQPPVSEPAEQQGEQETLSERIDAAKEKLAAALRDAVLDVDLSARPFVGPFTGCIWFHDGIFVAVEDVNKQRVVNIYDVVSAAELIQAMNLDYTHPDRVKAEPLTELWAVTYLHDWDNDGGIYPQIHSVHTTWQEAEKERATRMSPEKYWVTRARLQLPAAHGIVQQEGE